MRPSSLRCGHRHSCVCQRLDVWKRMYSCAQPASRVSSASCLPARLQNATGYAAFKQKSIAKLAGFQKSIAAAVNGAGRTLGVWDESFTAWGFAGTSMLPEGSMIFNWEAPEQTAAMTDAGCTCPAVIQPCCAPLCPALPIARIWLTTVCCTAPGC